MKMAKVRKLRKEKPKLPPPERRRKADDKDQSRAFINSAREIEADEKSSASDQLLGRLAKMKPEPRGKTK